MDDVKSLLKIVRGIPSTHSLTLHGHDTSRLFLQHCLEPKLGFRNLDVTSHRRAFSHGSSMTKVVFADIAVPRLSITSIYETGNTY